MRLLSKLTDEVVFAASDLHIGSPLSPRITLSAIRKGIANADMVVFCGDIFEGIARHWPVRKRRDACIEAISRWAEEAAAHGRAKPVVFIEGNHEVPILKNGILHHEAASLMAAIRECAQQFPHVHFHPAPHFQHGDALFLHGHVHLNYIDTPPGKMRNWTDKVLARVTPGWPTEIIHPRERTLRRIHQALQEEKFDAPVTHVVFGHTHAPFDNDSVPGLTLGGITLRFHNCGVSYKPKTFRPLYMEFRDGKVAEVRPTNFEYLTSLYSSHAPPRSGGFHRV